MLVTCAASASVDGSVCVFLEPIALYHARDLYEDGDDAWCAALNDAHVPVGAARTYLDGSDLTLVAWGNGLHMSLRVARRLAVRGVSARVVGAGQVFHVPPVSFNHAALVVEGIRMSDGTEGEIGPGDVASIAPGHCATRGLPNSRSQHSGQKM